MRNILNKPIFMLLLMVAPLSGSDISASNPKEDKQDSVKNIRFIPEKFNEVKLGYNERSENPCSPVAGGVIASNTISINTPEKIICHMDDKEFVPVIPVCASYMISLRRAYKYNHLSAQMIHIKDCDGTEYSAEIVRLPNPDIWDTPILPPHYEKMQKRKMREIKKAQKYNDDELYEGQASGGYMNVNLMEYVDIPFAPGKYEIWLSFSGLESNHTFVEVVREPVAN